ncbi:taurine ABC transporter substrate-binding protein [Goodfellowiella coeruleoviolacea]|uniref:Taurine transport system substrate-binding protein n=1 Tax=Goodfellowiella coeruleoviolacea TaxID=334858 RepID=A0AAE3KIT5_9PSEU|nr:glycine betaine ABC transporter substrate-binding protein [Goodfellowiella coeruleoviolacea]MCP2163613.1 taurine transport system substrate-binding protein [Goodfellowiella coeruleoviolacea]
MPTSSRISRRDALTLFGGIASASALAACGVGGSGTPPSTTSVRIAFQNFADSTLLVKDQGTLERALPGHTVTWTAFDSGASINTAFLSGALDIAVIGSSPTAQAICPPLGIPYQVIELLNVIGSSEALVVRAGSGITALAELTGHKIATPFSSTAHYSLLAALDQAGVDPGGVTLVDLEPQNILAAWQRGDIDGAYVWTPTLSTLRRDGTTLIDSARLAEAGKPTMTFAVAHNDFIASHPDVVDAWLTATNDAITQIGRDPAVVAEAVHRQLGISGADALAQLDQNIYLDLDQQRGADYFGSTAAPGALADRLRDTAEFLFQQKKVDSVPELATFRAALRVPEVSDGS